MSLNILHCLMTGLVLLMIIPAFSAEPVTNQESMDHWRSALHVSDDEGLLTGLQIALSVSPDNYYLENGSVVNITGSLNNMFGPVPETPVVFARGYQQKPTAIANLTTDEKGEFFYSDIVNRSGPVRYQAWYSFFSSDQPLVSSNEIEVMDIYNSSSNETPVDSSSGDHADENEAPVDPMAAAIFLDTDSREFFAGKNVTVSGIFTSNTIPLPYAIVTLEIGYPERGFGRIGDSLTTDKDGKFKHSFYLTGPESPVIRAVSTDPEGKMVISNEINLTFLSEAFSPPARLRTGSRHISASISPSVIEPGESITISGWFSDGQGEPVSSGRLNLYWYNFGDQIWDRYQMSSEAITTPDGYYSFNVSGPRLSGISYMAVVSKYEKTGKPLFSSVLFPRIRESSEPASANRSADIRINSTPEIVSVGGKADISFTLTDSDGKPLSGEPLSLFFSLDGFTWLMNGNSTLTTNTDGIITVSDVPQESGFHYYKGFFNGTGDIGSAQSDMFILPVLGGGGLNGNQILEPVSATEKKDSS